MTRLIDADALLDFIDVGHLRPPTEICFSEVMVKNIIELMPTVEATPARHGRWTVTPVYIKCSECGESFMLIPQNYCPNCGARMVEDDFEH